MITYIIVAVVTFVLYVKWRHSYWKRRGVPQLNQNKRFFVGDAFLEFIQKLSFGEAALYRYRKLRSMNAKHGGFYMFLSPVYMPVDLEILNHVLKKDFNHFLGHGTYHHESDKLTMHLFNLEGQKWKDLRIKLTPTFTSAKLKMMFETLVEKTQGLEKSVNRYAESGEPLAIKEVLARFTTDIIASCAFGIDCNSLEEPDNSFRKYGKKVFTPHLLKILCVFAVPWKLLNLLGFKISSREIRNFFTNIVLDTIKYREENKVFRKDFMHLLLQLKNEGQVTDDTTATTATTKSSTKGEHTLSEDEIIAQCFVFFVAGFETSSTTMNFALLELARNPDVQEKLREEIEEVLQKHKGKMSYDAVMEMNYLDMVIKETLRKFPAVPAIPRVCNKDFKVPGTNVIIQKGTRLSIPVWGIHMDPEYYPNPEKFNPENFSEKNKASRPEITFFPFGEGPRQCIGLRFGVLQSKVGLISLIRKFRFSLNSKTPQPIHMDSGTLVLMVKGEIWFDITKV